MSAEVPTPIHCRFVENYRLKTTFNLDKGRHVE